jgi:hypothetical protein
MAVPQKDTKSSPKEAQKTLHKQDGVKLYK